MKLREILTTYYYHATYEPYLSSIIKKGLKKNIAKKSWNGSEDFVYLATNKDTAESYAETSDDVPEDFLDKIVILKIDGNMLNPNLLSKDKLNKSGDTLQYDGNIKPEAISVVK